MRKVPDTSCSPHSVIISSHFTVFIGPDDDLSAVHGLILIDYYERILLYKVRKLFKRKDVNTCSCFKVQMKAAGLPLCLRKYCFKALITLLSVPFPGDILTLTSLTWLQCPEILRWIPPQRNNPTSSSCSRERLEGLTSYLEESHQFNAESLTVLKANVDKASLILGTIIPFRQMIFPDQRSGLGAKVLLHVSMQLLWFQIRFVFLYREILSWLSARGKYLHHSNR